MTMPRNHSQSCSRDDVMQLLSRRIVCKIEKERECGESENVRRKSNGLL